MPDTKPRLYYPPEPSSTPRPKSSHERLFSAHTVTSSRVLDWRTHGISINNSGLRGSQRLGHAKWASVLARIKSQNGEEEDDDEDDGDDFSSAIDFSTNRLPHNPPLGFSRSQSTGSFEWRGAGPHSMMPRKTRHLAAPTPRPSWTARASSERSFTPVNSRPWQGGKYGGNYAGAW